MKPQFKSKYDIEEILKESDEEDDLKDSASAYSARGYSLRLGGSSTSSALPERRRQLDQRFQFRPRHPDQSERAEAKPTEQPSARLGTSAQAAHAEVERLSDKIGEQEMDHKLKEYDIFETDPEVENLLREGLRGEKTELDIDKLI